MAQRLSFLVQMIFVESESANAETITRTLVTELNHCDLSVGKLNWPLHGWSISDDWKNQWGGQQAERVEQTPRQRSLHLP